MGRPGPLCVDSAGAVQPGRRQTLVSVPPSRKSAAVGLSCYFATFRAGLLRLSALMGGVVGSARSLFGGKCLAVRCHWFPARRLASCLVPLVGCGARLLGAGLFPLPLHRARRIRYCKYPRPILRALRPRKGRSQSRGKRAFH